MKKINYIILFAAAILFAGCNGKGNEPEQPTLSFEYKKIPPFTYQFTNTSIGYADFKWDFGDGNFATMRDAEHTYAAAGKYIVTLTATLNGEKYDTRLTLTVPKPKVYMDGFVLYSIPYQNKYYRVVCLDDDIITHWDYYTISSPLLDNSDLPYSFAYNPKLMDGLDGDNYYNIYVYYANNSTATGTECIHGKLQKTDILKYRSEYIFTSGNTKVGVQMHYE